MNNRKIYIKLIFLSTLVLLLTPISMFADTNIEVQTNIEVSLTRKIIPGQLPATSNEVKNYENDKKVYTNKYQNFPKTNDLTNQFILFLGIFSLFCSLYLLILIKKEKRGCNE